LSIEDPDHSGKSEATNSDTGQKKEDRSDDTHIALWRHHSGTETEEKEKMVARWSKRSGKDPPGKGKGRKKGGRKLHNIGGWPCPELSSKSARRKRYGGPPKRVIHERARV